ncbi:methyltransferase domain-containing protein [Paenibacillus sp. FSL M7-1455]|uniref:class I SAM-dependent methyltransferase n=1 Tax=Paenibacillus sp. FSL M7-1455 TaxID=2975316 RepID=UPI0030F98ABC
MAVRYMGDKDFWDHKFTERDGRLMGPEKMILENSPLFQKGTLLDLACGDGRNALYFLKQGFKVTGIDFSRKALDRLRRFAAEHHYAVRTQELDLSRPDCLKEVGIYDNIVVNHYRLGKEHLGRIHLNLASGGLLFVCGFGHKHKEDPFIREEDLIMPSDFDHIDPSLKRIRYLEEEDRRGFLVAYLYRKTS